METYRKKQTIYYYFPKVSWIQYRAHLVAILKDYFITVPNNSYHFWANLLHKWSFLGMNDMHEYIQNAMPTYYVNQFSMGYI